VTILDFARVEIFTDIEIQGGGGGGGVFRVVTLKVPCHYTVSQPRRSRLACQTSFQKNSWSLCHLTIER